MVLISPNQTVRLNAEQISSLEIDRFGSSTNKNYKDSIFSVTEIGPTLISKGNSTKPTMEDPYWIVTRVLKKDIEKSKFDATEGVILDLNQLLALRIQENGHSIIPEYREITFKVTQVREGIYSVKSL